MNLTKFKSTVEKQGLARNTRWEMRIYPPKGLGKSFDLGGGFSLNANLPGIDMIDNGIEQINNLSFDLPGLSFQNNLELPTLGYMMQNQGGKLDKLTLYCNMVNLPERDIQNFEWREFGESRQMGVGHNNSRGISVSYYCSEDMRERKFFEEWQNLIFNPSNKRKAFYDDYIGRMEIVKYSADWKTQEAVYRVHEVYPSNIAAQTMVYEGTSVLRLDIQFKMYNYERIK